MDADTPPLPGLDDVGIPGRLTYLRPVEREDAPLLRFLMNDPLVTSTTVGFNLPVSADDQQRWIDGPRRTPDGPWHFTIVERSSRRAVGITTVGDVDWFNRTATNGTKIHPSVQRSGLALDAGMARLAWCFFILGLHRINSSALETNAASIAGLEKAGYVYEGRRRQAVLRDGRRVDLLLYGLLREEAERHPLMPEYRDLVLGR